MYFRCSLVLDSGAIPCHTRMIISFCDVFSSSWQLLMSFLTEHPSLLVQSSRKASIPPSLDEFEETKTRHSLNPAVSPSRTRQHANPHPSSQTPLISRRT